MNNNYRQHPRYRKIIISVILIAVISTVSFSVSFAESAEPLAAATGVSLSETECTLVVGQTHSLDETVLPEDADDKTVTWESANESIATVSNGEVTAVAEGTATITVTTTVGGHTATCTVTVVPAVNVTGVTLDQKTLSLAVNENATLTPTITPNDATNPNVSWRSDHTDIATVTDDGIVTAVSTGSATITVTTEDGGFTAKCSVTATRAATGIKLDTRSLLVCEDDAQSLTATISPSDATNQNVTWKSSNTNVVTVSKGVVKAVAAGTATITATAKDGGYTATCTVKVLPKSICTSVYTIDSSKGFLKRIAKNTSVTQLKKNLLNDSTYIKLYKTDGSVYTGSTVGTGMKVKLIVNDTVRNELSTVVLGDGNGDGKINIADYTLTRLEILELQSLTGAYKSACDINGDGKIGISDYTLMRLDILDLKPISGSEQYLPEVSNAKVREFLDVALQQFGKPYVWGAEGPSGFDCSGYVYYCLRQVGYNVYRTTADSYSDFSQWKKIDRDKLEPGDLMFYWSDSIPGRIGHIGIYLGNGYHIHASSTYQCVLICQVDGWYDEKLAFGRRVF